MAYLGNSGFLKLKRTAPDPIVVPASAVNVVNNYVTVNYDDWLLTEDVHLIYAGGFVNGYAHRDTLDRIYLHSTVQGALSNSNDTRLTLIDVSVDSPIILAASINASQRSALETFATTLTSVTTERRLRAWPQITSTIRSLATVNPWQLQGELKSWQLTRSAPEIDTTALGDEFSSAIKAVVSGSGSFDFLIDLYSSTNQSDVDPLLRLVHLTERGSTAEARFYLKGQTSYETCAGLPDQRTRVNQSVFFYSQILITECSVEVGAEDMVAGSANFVTTGPIRLLTE